MREIHELEYHPVSERLVQILCEKTQSSNPLFFRIIVAYYFAKVASMMRASIKTHDRGVLPINLYVINLATSGTGKGYSMNIMEDTVIKQFRENFLEYTFNEIAQPHLAKLANRRAIRKQGDPDEELERVQKEFDDAGELAFSFDSGTPAAIKQMRHKLLMADAGSMNLEIDEIGSNLVGNTEALNAFLELYDVGKIKQKLIKNTKESVRNEEIEGKTPTNLLLYGTPSKLFNGSKTEEEFFSMLEAGYARRCLFSYSRNSTKVTDATASEVYDLLTNEDTDEYLMELSDRLAGLADSVNFNKKLVMSKAVSLLTIEYRLRCERRAEKMGEHDEIRKAEVSHRYFKALKLAGAYAFIDGSHELTEDHLYQAIKLVEESGESLDRLLTRDRNYVKLAKYIAYVNSDVTHADLVEDLPFYRGANAQKQEMMTLATAWGYKNNIIIKRVYTDGIEFLRGESLEQTDLSQITVSYSDHLAYHYRGESVPFDELHKLTQAAGYHWTNHCYIDQHRQDEKAIPGFNLVVVDVDGGVSLDTAKLLLRDYKALYYTTKRHTSQENRFRILLPINYRLKLDSRDFKEFMANLFEWLPFAVDDGTGQRNKKWLSHAGHHEYTDGEVLDALQFIPKTSKNEERKERLLNQQSLSNLERWFVNNTGEGNRSKQLIKYALLLVDSGQSWDQVRMAVLELNSKLQDSLTEAEIMVTIMSTVGKSIAQREQNAA